MYIYKNDPIDRKSSYSVFGVAATEPTAQMVSSRPICVPLSLQFQVGKAKKEEDDRISLTYYGQQKTTFLWRLGPFSPIWCGRYSPTSSCQHSTTFLFKYCRATQNALLTHAPPHSTGRVHGFYGRIKRMTAFK